MNRQSRVTFTAGDKVGEKKSDDFVQGVVLFDDAKREYEVFLQGRTGGIATIKSIGNAIAVLEKLMDEVMRWEPYSEIDCVRDNNE